MRGKSKRNILKIQDPLKSFSNFLKLKIKMVCGFLRKKNINMKKRQFELDKEPFYRLDIFDIKPPVGYFRKLAYFLKSPLVKFFYSMVN